MVKKTHDILGHMDCVDYVGYRDKDFEGDDDICIALCTTSYTCATFVVHSDGTFSYGDTYGVTFQDHKVQHDAYDDVLVDMVEVDKVVS